MKTEQSSHPHIPFDPTSEVPFYRQVYESCREIILSGRIRPGQRLPSTRALAVDLGISRLPVVVAFEQLLHEGYIQGRVGSGSYVSETIPDELTRPVVFKTLEDPRLLKKRGRSRYLGLPGQDILGAFRVSLPALDQFPERIWKRLLFRHAKNFHAKEMAYGQPAGVWALRETIAEYVSTARAVRCDASQILIVSGSQLALQICAKALLQDGGEVCIEEPGYPGARQALGGTGAKLNPIEIDEEGMRVRKLDQYRKKARLVYVTPSHQYPLGVTMTATRRLELLDWAERNQAWIIEDDYDSEYRYASRPLGSLQGMDASSRVIYIGTFSKVLFPSLRLGYVVVPQELYPRFVEIRESFDIFSPTLYQLVVADFINEGHFARHLRRMRNVYLSRRNALLDSLEGSASQWLKPHNADAGIHLSAFLPQKIRDREVVFRAAKNRISVTPLSVCYFGQKKTNGLILGFGGANERRIKNAARQLIDIIKDCV
jgi:GntR family transcriptional regulator/MocR family aminotransferase